MTCGDWSSGVFSSDPRLDRLGRAVAAAAAARRRWGGARYHSRRVGTGEVRSPNRGGGRERGEIKSSADPLTRLAPIRFGRAILGDLEAAERREWWLGNGRGGYGARPAPLRPERQG